MQQRQLASATFEGRKTPHIHWNHLAFVESIKMKICSTTLAEHKYNVIAYLRCLQDNLQLKSLSGTDDKMHNDLFHTSSVNQEVQKSLSFSSKFWSGNVTTWKILCTLHLLLSCAMLMTKVKSYNIPINGLKPLIQWSLPSKPLWPQTWLRSRTYFIK